MKCPMCTKELEIIEKQVGMDDNAAPIMNKYAVCQDCKKQWSLKNKSANKEAKKREAVKPTPKELNLISENTSYGKDKPKMESFSITLDRPAKAENLPKTTAKPQMESTFKASEQRRKTSTVSKSNSKSNRPSSQNANSRSSNQSARSRSGNQSTRSRSSSQNIGMRQGNQAKQRPNTSAHAGSRLSSNTKSNSRPQNNKRRSAMERMEPEEKPFYRAIRIIMGILVLLGSGYMFWQGIEGGYEAMQGNESRENIFDLTVVMIPYIYLGLTICFLLTALVVLVSQKKNASGVFIAPAIILVIGSIAAFLWRGDSTTLLSAAVASALFAIIFILLLVLKSRKEDEMELGYEDE